MSISVVEARSIEQFLEPWKKAMQSIPWFRERRLFDYHPDELIEGMKQAFHDPNFLFLVANRKDRGARANIKNDSGVTLQTINS